ncbi:hypothetical protein [Streptomyces sp. NPDC048638]|uniref:hypothetical protein n=1 Tax=Streptomyces sp. NPDC048638 TaxID=3365580 RepID=UPI003722CAED
MVPDVSRGSRTIGLLHYLYRTSDIEAHVDPRLVAAYDPHLPDPGRDPKATFSGLAADLDLWVDALGDKAPKKHVWHCPVRTAPGDRTLTDGEWATVAPASSATACSAWGRGGGFRVGIGGAFGVRLVYEDSLGRWGEWGFGL